MFMIDLVVNLPSLFVFSDLQFITVHMKRLIYSCAPPGTLLPVAAFHLGSFHRREKNSHNYVFQRFEFDSKEPKINILNKEERIIIFSRQLSKRR